MLDVWLPLLQEQFRNYPVLMLQAAAIVGVLSTVLGLRRKTAPLLGSGGVAYGWALGISGFLLVGLAFDFLALPSKPYLNTDVLFLGGLFGGWPGGAICWACMVCARLLFGGLTNGFTAAIDMAVLALGGILMHRWAAGKKLVELSLRDVWVVWLAKMAFSLGSVVAIGGLGLIPGKTNQNLLVLRLLGAALSWAILGGLLVLLRREARDREVAERAQAQERTDPLTGLPNRRALREHLDALATRAGEGASSVLTLELSNLGEMVRLHGHGWSDQFWGQLVAAVRAHALTCPLQPYDPHYFMLSDLTLSIVLRGVTLEKLQYTGMADHFYAELSDYLLRTRAGEAAPRLRMGVAMGNDGTHKSADAILRNLSLALQSDARPLRYFHRSFEEKALLDEKLRAMLVGWISAGRAPLAYQPKCDLRTGQVLGAEALLRAKDASGHPISPPLVLEVAARNQLLIEFEWCTVETVVHAIGVGLAAQRPLPLAVNVSAASLTVPGFGLRVVSLLRRTRTPCDLLTVEVTENSPVPDIDTVGESMAAMASAGVKLSLDDFGTGYSGLSMLAKFTFTEIKIDQSMVARLEQPRMQAAVSLAQESAVRYHASLVAEGVETPMQIERLYALGIRCGQGYHFARAMELASLLACGRLPHGVPVVAEPVSQW
ncbi:EAL domain-containing protein [Rhodoferax sp. WC2427]|uniref:EAL domain-containing protein n=1 Tax=Rhodoferax sp. WC2427 TaxID=3234144 RepID=UPI00346593E6